MDLKTAAVSVATIMVGWMLNEVSQRFRSRRVHKGALGKAISDLLEIRHQIIAITTSIEEVSKIMPNGIELKSEIWPVIGKLIPDTNEIKNRFNGAVDVIAETDPILAYRLRSKDIILKIMLLLAEVKFDDQNGKDFIVTLRDILSEGAITELDRSIKAVSLSYGVLCRLKTNQVLKLNAGETKDGELIFGLLKNTIDKVSGRTMQVWL